MTLRYTVARLSVGAISVFGIVSISGTDAWAQGCSSLLSLFQQGRSNVEIARMTGLPSDGIAACRRELSQPIVVGPEGPPPRDAAGPAPRRAAGPPPVGAVGPPPVGAAGPAPVGREVKRIP